MPITTADIIACMAEFSPFDDVSTVGGAIHTTGRILPNILSSVEKLQFQSNDVDDIQTLTVIGRMYNGHIATELVVLNGTSIVKGKVAFRTVLEVSLSSVAIGTITVARQSDAGVILSVGVGEVKYSSFFKGAFPDEYTELVRYDKFFIHNTHLYDQFQNVVITPIADSTGVLQFGLAAGGQNDNLSSSNRKTLSSIITFTNLNVPIPLDGGILPAGNNIGVWLRQRISRKQRLNEVQTISIKVTGDHTTSFGQDLFTDSDNVNIVDHIPNSGFDGWNLNGGFSDKFKIFSNQVRDAAGDGLRWFVWNTVDLDLDGIDFHGYADLTRGQASFDPEEQGLLLFSEAAGNPPGCVRVYWASKTPASATHVKLVISRWTTSLQQSVEVNINFPWATGVARRLGYSVVSDEVFLWTEPSGGGARTVHGSLVLSPTQRDGSHKRAGFFMYTSQTPGATAHKFDNLNVYQFTTINKTIGLTIEPKALEYNEVKGRAPIFTLQPPASYP